MTQVSTKSSFVGIIVMHTDLVISGAQIQLRKPTSAVEFIEQFINSGDRKPILYGDGIQRAVIDTKSP
jgi:hypothetical protein